MVRWRDYLSHVLWKYIMASCHIWVIFLVFCYIHWDHISMPRLCATPWFFYYTTTILFVVVTIALKDDIVILDVLPTAWLVCSIFPPSLGFTSSQAAIQSHHAHMMPQQYLLWLIPFTASLKLPFTRHFTMSSTFYFWVQCDTGCDDSIELSSEQPYATRLTQKCPFLRQRESRRRQLLSKLQLSRTVEDAKRSSMSAPNERNGM